MQQWLKGIIRRPVTVAMITIAAVTFGVLALGRLPIELLPDITYPTLTVQTELPDASPQEVEQLITDPIEDVVGVGSNVVRVSSKSIETEWPVWSTTMPSMVPPASPLVSLCRVHLQTLRLAC